MSEHVDWLRAFADSVDRIIKSCEGRPARDYVAEYQKPKRDNLRAAADHLERCEAALRDSTKLLRTIGPELADVDYTRLAHEQISANEAALGGG